MATAEESVCDVIPSTDILLKSNMEINQDNSLGLPPYYNGSNMFMPTGERVYWQAEVVPAPIGTKTIQDFEEIRSHCLTEDVLYEDPVFLMSDCPADSVQWLRPKEFVENPQFFTEGISRFDVNQGLLADCWMDSSLAALTMHKALFNRVVPSDQSFDKDYAGVFHFRFWQYGRWVDVVIDDRLPTSEGKLLFLHSSQQNEFWSALLEKAYAKLHGSYKALDFGFVTEALEDFSGGFTEIFNVSEPKENFFKILLDSYNRKSLIGASVQRFRLELQGLFFRHAYTITCVKYLDPQTPLLRIRNPYGTFEWTGPWCDDSSEWKSVPKDKVDALDFKPNDDGEFWISFEDFTKYFSFVYVCNLNPESLYPDGHCNVKWEISMFEGKWIKGETAGGWGNTTYWQNPQIHITLSDPDKEDEEETCTVLIYLMQKFKRTRLSRKFFEIGFAVYKVDVDSPDLLDERFFKEHKPVFELKRWLALRGVGEKLKLPVGRYVIVPSTLNANEEAEFFLRVISEKPQDLITSPQVVLI